MMRPLRLLRRVGVSFVALGLLSQFVGLSAHDLVGVRLPGEAASSRSAAGVGTIVGVADGDTLRVQLGEAVEVVRLLGIDTPETHRPGRPVECGGLEASARMLALTFTGPRDTNGDGLVDAPGGRGRSVQLWADPSQESRDRYGRLLAYARLRDGGDLALEQLRAGAATVYIFAGRPVRRAAAFHRAQAAARAAGRGAWGACGGDFHRPR